MAELLDRSVMPEAVFCIDDNLAMGAVFECQRRGIAVPGEISIMGFNDLEFAKSAEPSISTVATPRYEMGKLAAEIAMEIVAKGKRRMPRQIDVGFSILARASTGPRT
jgi:LacI family gluconate utilization system Gnt-I transcriptional repressor